jgi:hypothetical protein
MRVAALSAILFAAAASIASARWQYTKWGMTPSQVISASHGKAVATTDQEKVDQGDGSSEIAVLKSQWQSGSLQFTAFFYFSQPGGHLKHITLRLESSDRMEGARLLGSLRQKYGKSHIQDPGDTMTIEAWYSGGDQVTYKEVLHKFFSVDYQPLRNSDNSGL